MANQLCYEEEEIVSVKLPPAKLNSLRAPYRYAFHGKVLFKTIRPDHLYTHLIRIWSPEGTIKIHELANGFFVIVFSHPTDFLKVFWNGPWMISGHYITLQPFAFNFKPLEAIITRTPIWVRLPQHPSGGFLVKIHAVTEKRARMNFAQLCVELDVSKPLPSCVEICGLMQRVEYVGLHLICGSCKRAGHSREDCLFYHPQPDLASRDSFEYGPWIRAENSRVAFIRSIHSDGSSGSSSDLIREASTRYLQSGEGTSSSVTNTRQSPECQKETRDSGKTPMAEEKAAVSEKPLEKKATIAVQTANIQNNSCPPLNPFSPPFLVKAFGENSASHFYTEYVKKSASHKVINAKSILLIDQSKEPVILSTTEEVSSIHTSLSISPLTAGKARINVTPKVPDHDVQSTPASSPRKMLCWTCGGADDSKVANAIDELIATHNPSVVFLSQMSTAGPETCQVITDSKFSGSFFVNPIGHMGGMWLLWRKEEIKVDIESATLTDIKATVHLTGEGQI